VVEGDCLLKICCQVSIFTEKVARVLGIKGKPAINIERKNGGERVVLR
jgi:hypothetical protein